jgi:hypothetical protein
MTEDLKLHIKRWQWGNSPNKYQVGPMLFFREIQLDNYFIMKLYRKYISKENFDEFYQYHLDHYKFCSKEANEETHFKIIWEIVEGGISIQNRHPYSELAKRRKVKLLAFKQYLKTIDQWDHAASLNELVQLKNNEIDELNHKLDSARKELSKLKIDYKIKINHVDRTSIFDLFLQMRELESTKTGSRIFNDPAQSTWAKILSNHFEDDQPIPFDTALNYFRGKSKIQSKHKVFSIK